jgi:[ribosomal protein S5]-alanine N-acetyltransferase
VRLRPVAMADCSERYVSWLRDPLVNRFLETRWSEQTIETVQAFVGAMLESPHSHLLAIVERATERHVGNVKIGPVNAPHSFADISYFIGEREVWGRGLATEAVALATRFGFEALKLHRLQAGLYESNAASRRVLERAGYIYEGSLKAQLRLDGGWEDHLWFGALCDQWKIQEL